MSLIIPNGMSGVSLSNDLQAIAGLTGTGVVKRTGDGTAALLSSTTIGESVLTATDAAAVRTAIGSPGFVAGTYTPAYLMSTSGSITPSVALGHYLIIDSLCWVSIRLVTGSLSSPVGSVTVTLPFAAAADPPSLLIDARTISGWATDMPNAHGAIVAGDQYMILRKNASNAVPADIVASDLSATGNILWVNGFYLI